MYSSNHSASTITTEERTDQDVVDATVATIVLEDELVQETATPTGVPSENIFSLNVDGLLQGGGAVAPPSGGGTARRRPVREASSERSSGGGQRAPSPTSHHVGVGGGGWNHHLTPTRCEAGPEVVTRV